jgi:hypothetical protein
MELSVDTEKIPSDTTGIDPGTLRLIAQCLNHYTIQGHLVDWDDTNFRGMPRDNRGYCLAAVFIVHSLSSVRGIREFRHSQVTQTLSFLSHRNAAPFVGKFSIWMTFSRKS